MPKANNLKAMALNMMAGNQATSSNADAAAELAFHALAQSTEQTAEPLPQLRGSPDNVMLKTETLKFVRAYNRIRDPKVREALNAMTKAMAKGAGTP